MDRQAAPVVAGSVSDGSHRGERHRAQAGNYRSGRVGVGVTVEDLGRGRRIDGSTTLVDDNGFEELAADERERIASASVRNAARYTSRDTPDGPAASIADRAASTSACRPVKGNSTAVACTPSRRSSASTPSQQYAPCHAPCTSTTPDIRQDLLRCRSAPPKGSTGGLASWSRRDIPFLPAASPGGPRRQRARAYSLGQPVDALRDDRTSSPPDTECPRAPDVPGNAPAGSAWPETASMANVPRPSPNPAGCSPCAIFDLRIMFVGSPEKAFVRSMSSNSLSTTMSL